MRRALFALLIVLPAVGLTAGSTAAQYASLPGGTFKSVLRFEDVKTGVRIKPFAMMRTPVTNAQFLEFVKKNPKWQKGKAPGVFTESRYLNDWAGPVSLGPKALPDRPVVWVSWFAASAYCESQGARLPTWNEWEYAAAADETRRDARQDPAWRERILAWYSKSSKSNLPRVGLQPANAYGLRDLHGLVWEWAEDANALMMDSDNRNQGDPNKAKFCGAGALSMDDRENYAVMMRVAMLSSLEAHDATANMGFRCARSTP
ncbi:MAG: formylglycine-generating enzyme family protein [Thermomonas sp.]|uniref:formylglycine-generating enzyme family protein n=1 Tax=Thermomonas sp. TaxID=1971895 RepID=UPI001ED0C9AB|nr:formylglycine-generating enzyme family protein [Thermomonas sp.]MBV2209235.1 formylglycine-generating enzyme family protein [Thermomonas sp.]